MNDRSFALQPFARDRPVPGFEDHRQYRPARRYPDHPL